ncbi:hypothetical protein D3C73_1078640 [compost metagenome]
MRTKTPEIEALLPKATGPNRLQISMLDTASRHGAAYQPFGIRVQGMRSWYIPDTKQVLAIQRLMKADGWKTTGLQQTPNATHWFIDFV